MVGRWPVTEISVVIPVRNEAALVGSALKALQPYRDAGCELILVDGESHDDTLALASPWVDKTLSSRAGRAQQMNLGAHAACGDYLLFLHIDSRLPGSPASLHAAVAALRTGPARWAYGRVQLLPASYALSIIAMFMRARARLTRVATGDQLLLVERELFMHCGGFALLPLMEDVELCKRLRQYTAPHRAALAVHSSSRRWHRDGVASTVLLMWWLRLQYWLGVDPRVLARRYYRAG